MKTLLNIVLYITVAASVIACKEEMSPLASATVAVTVSGRLTEKSLSAEQLQSLTSWLVKHRSGWQMCLATPPASDTAFSLLLKHNNGSTSYLKLHSLSGWRNTIEASHLGGSNRSNQPCALHTFSDQELNELRASLGIQNG